MVPLTRPEPPRLSEAVDLLREVESSGIFTNFGPVNQRFEQSLCEQVFDNVGTCLTVCNATIGLMVCIRQAIEARGRRQVYALMPSFTFAAAAQAALWCGLKPLFCDIDPLTWAMDPEAEARLLRQYRGRIAVIVPYATFGYDIDLDRYERLSRQSGVPVVVDAASSLGTLSSNGHGFGTGFSGPIVFSMHATKSFGTGEGGVVYSANRDLIDRLRPMTNFGFGEPRVATMPGLNAKLSEIAALLALLRLRDYDAMTAHRGGLMRFYRASLPEMMFQPVSSLPQAHQFAPALLPPGLAFARGSIQAQLKTGGIGSATYFSPHLAEQAYFARLAPRAALPVTDDVASRVVSLPLYDSMTWREANEVVSCLKAALAALLPQAHGSRDDVEATVLPSPVGTVEGRSGAPVCATFA